MKILLTASVVLSVLYIAYRLFLKNETDFKHLRLYLFLSMLLTVVLPFNNYTIDFELVRSDKKEYFKSVLHGNAESYPSVPLQSKIESRLRKTKTISPTMDFWKKSIRTVYLLGVGFFVAKILFQLLILVFRTLRANKIRKKGYVLVYNHGFRNSFSFFHWIFINQNNQTQDDLEKVIAHELVHARQYHSLDSIMMEFLAAIMWFNPFVWMMRNSLQLIHEYLADEGVISGGVDRLNYQELLINQVAEEKLISISSSFNQSLIKKRIIMMNQKKITMKTGYKILVLIPVAAILFVALSCINGQKENEDKSEKKINSSVNENTVTAIAPTKMNVLYVGVENPVKVAVSGYESSELNVTIINGAIKGENGNYTIIPRRQGNVVLTVYANGERIEQTQFRAKSIPTPVVYVNRQAGGKITKEDLLKQEDVKVFMQNFDFDVSFKVISFTLSTTDDEGFYVSVDSESDKITDEQIQLIKSTKTGQRVNFEDVKVIGPDGDIRGVAPIVFEIVN